MLKIVATTLPVTGQRMHWESDAGTLWGGLREL